MIAVASSWPSRNETFSPLPHHALAAGGIYVVPRCVDAIASGQNRGVAARAAADRHWLHVGEAGVEWRAITALVSASLHLNKPLLGLN